MNTKFLSADRNWKCVAADFIYSATLLLLSIFFVAYILNKSSGYYRLYDFIDGTAERPQVFRQLIRWLLIEIEILTPTSLKLLLLEIASRDSSFLSAFIYAIGGRPERAVQAIAMTIIDISSIFITLQATRKLFNSMYVVAAPANWLVALAVLIGLFILHPSGPRYIYDFPAIALTTCAFVFLANRDWGRYYVILLIAALNKETALLLLVPMVTFWGAHMRPLKLLTHLMLHIGVALSIFGMRALEFGSGVDTVVVNNLEFNLQQVFFNDSYRSFDRMMSVTFLALMVFGYFNRKAIFLRHLMLLIPFWFVLFLRGGYWGEIRQFQELLPIIAIASIDTVFRICEVPIDLLQVIRPQQVTYERCWRLFANNVPSLLIAMLGVTVSLSLYVNFKSWRNSFHPTVRAVIDAQSTITRRDAGTRWDAPGNLIFWQSGLRVNFNQMTRAKFIDIALDCNDRYVVQVKSGDRTLRVFSTNAQLNAEGLLVHKLGPLDDLSDGFDSVLIQPVEGDGKYSMGHLILIP